ncbi:MAG: hypothetical protein J3R72DRAFT_444925 [Linnemannia gamsii]|nr:MAG: hypothetical protein J3R72DRAFT_444925 [Linnemannia gamsii]
MHEEFYLDLGLQEEGQEQEQEQEQGMIDVVNGDDHNENDIVGNENGDDHQDEDIPELIRRQSPLLNLKKLVAWGMEHLTVPEILNIFDDCPNIDRLKVPPVSFSSTGSELTTLATSISDRCPHLRTLSVLDKPDGPLFLRLMETMPPNQLFAVKINTFEYSGIDYATTRRVFSNHAQSLRVVDLRYTTGMSSKDLVTILEVCAGLEEFKKHPAPNSGDLFITLSDAISVPWACKGIRSLELTIGIPEIKDEAVPYYRRPAPIVLGVQEERQFGKLERFYRQIGSLVMLEHLDLRAVNYDSRYDDDVDGNERQELDNQSTDEETHMNAFPALLSLPSTSSSTTTDNNNWPGYLDHLAGWTHLKTLRGSIRLDVGANAATVGEKELDWFVHHWPALEQVAFFRDEKKRKKNKAAPELLLKLREARPRLVLW